MKMNDLRKENHLSPDTIEKTKGLLAAVWSRVQTLALRFIISSEAKHTFLMHEAYAKQSKTGVHESVLCIFEVNRIQFHLMMSE